MAILFRADDLAVSDSWIRTATAAYPIADVRSAWVSRRQIGRGGRLATAALGVAAMLALIGGTGLAGWVSRHWIWLLAAPLLFFVAAGIGLLDPVAIYLEKRRHELWIATDAVEVCVWQHNRVEVNKALRAINRAYERNRDQYEV